MNPMEAREVAMKRLALATDFEAVRIFEAFAKQITHSVTVSRDELAATVPADLRIAGGTDVIAQLDRRADEVLSPGTSVQSARGLLVLAAEDRELAVLVNEAHESWRDDRQLVDIVTTIGLVGAAWMVLASTRFSFKDGKFEIEKVANTSEQLEAFAAVIRAVLGLSTYGERTSGVEPAALPDQAGPDTPPKSAARTARRRTP
jgi:hypothetical protein